ncbi:MAG: sulfite exporter TauE/SafE family protein [Candidatus Omnitrophica bacterium]|nr:sulfite exporter TauE/SafE family protein [Candidatus Omnitrophota bacterium]MBU4488142.1 sulfite exporter TauE/SafE family protein [Candidatus Omnitrophota bacterium]MCG2704529.1 sulfite exporter TauE/SafE family protein [Candidatus Omnitrophota bacterium]
MQIAAYILAGIIAGVASGFFGIGGGIILVPIMVLIFGLTQHQAQGTTLALMVPPIGILAALKYYHAGNVNLKMAIFICLGFVAGGYLGAVFANNIPASTLKRFFGYLLFFTSLKFMFGK